MKLKSFILLIIFSIFLPLTAISEKPLDLDQVLAKYYEAIGGLEKWQGLNTMVMTGTMKSAEQTMPITASYERPAKCRIEFNIKDTMMAQVYGGHFGWQLNPLSGNPDPSPMSQGRTRYLRDTCGIESSLIDYKKKGYQVKLLGKEKIDGKEAYKINLKYPSRNIETYYIDTKTFLITRTLGIYNMDGNEIRTTTNFYDYKDTDGYVVPYKLIIKIHGAPSSENLNIDKFAFNPKIDSTMFDFPKDKIMKMQNKQDIKKPKK